MPGPRLIYYHWTPDLITVASSAGEEPLREPPDVVINRDGKIAGLGQEAEAAARVHGMELVRFPDVDTAWKRRTLASTFLSYYWLTVEFRGRSDWWGMLAGLWPSLHSYLIVHPTGGAEQGLGEEQAKWLRRAFRHSRPGRTFVWSGARLDPVARLADADGRGRWIGGAPRQPI